MVYFIHLDNRIPLTDNVTIRILGQLCTHIRVSTEYCKILNRIAVIHVPSAKMFTQNHRLSDNEMGYHLPTSFS